MTNFHRIAVLFSISFYCMISFSFNSLAQEKLHLENYDGIPGNSHVHDITLHNNNLWITTNRGLFEINQATNEVNAFLNGKSLQTICFLGNSKLIGNKNKIINIQSKILYKFESDVLIYHLVPFKNDLWVGTNQGIFVINTKNYRVIEHYSTDNTKLLSNHIKVLHKDDHNILWVGTEKGYLRITDKWEKLRNKKLNVLSVSENKEGVWLLNENELLFTFYDGRGNEIGLERGLRRGDVKDIAVNTNNKVYIASNVLIGLDPYSDTSNNLGEEISLLSKQVTRMKFDQQNFLWVGTKNSGLFKLTIEDLQKAKINEDTVTKPEALKAFILVSQDIKCSGVQEGELTVQASGGTPPYQYVWNNGSTEGNIMNMAIPWNTIIIF